MNFFFCISKKCTKMKWNDPESVKKSEQNKSFCMSCDVWTAVQVHAWMGKPWGLDSLPKKDEEGKKSRKLKCLFTLHSGASWHLSVLNSQMCFSVPVFVSPNGCWASSWEKTPTMSKSHMCYQVCCHGHWRLIRANNVMHFSSFSWRLIAWCLWTVNPCF